MPSSLVSAAAGKQKPDKRPVALLLPLTGERAALGLSMSRAAALAESDASLVMALDTGGTAAGARAAAAAAIKRRAALVLGPLTSDEALALRGLPLPVIAFTNDAAVAAEGLYVFGLTPRQSTSAVLRYARSRGVRDVVALGDGSAWSLASSAAALALQADLGLNVRTVTVTPGAPPPLVGDAPDAVLATGGGEGVLAAARALKDTGVQLLATVQALDHRPAALSALDGAWIAAPDPTAFRSFSSDFEAKVGGSPGALAALAFDAVGVSRVLRGENRLSGAGLLAHDGFAGITGKVSFRTNGTCARDFAILLASANGYEAVATSRGS